MFLVMEAIRKGKTLACSSKGENKETRSDSESDESEESSQILGASNREDDTHPHVETR